MVLCVDLNILIDISCKNKILKLMEIKIDKTKPVEVLVNFTKPLSCYEISNLLGDAVVECNRIIEEEREKLPLFKRIFTSCDVYLFDRDEREYFSYDGKAPMRPCGHHVLDREMYPDVKYEWRSLMSIVSTKSMYLYFNVIPGLAKEDQFGTEMLDTEKVSCITIKANMKSSLKWKKQQAKFLELLTSTIENFYKEKKWGHRIGDLFFWK